MNIARLWTIGHPLFHLDFQGAKRAHLALRFSQLRENARSAQPDTLDIQLPLFTELLRQGFRPEDPDKDGVTPLMWAAGMGDEFLNVVFLALKSNPAVWHLPGDSTRQDNAGNTVLHHWTGRALKILGMATPANRPEVVESLSLAFGNFFRLNSAGPLDVPNHAGETPLALMLAQAPDLMFDMLNTMKTSSLASSSRKALLLAALRVDPRVSGILHASALYRAFRMNAENSFTERPDQQIGSIGPLMSLLVDEVPKWGFEAMDVLYDERHLFSTAAWLARDAKGECALTRLWAAGGKSAHRNLASLVDWSVEPTAIETAYLTECANQEREALVAGIPDSGDAPARPPRRHL